MGFYSLADSLITPSVWPYGYEGKRAFDPSRTYLAFDGVDDYALFEKPEQLRVSNYTIKARVRAVTIGEIVDIFSSVYSNSSTYFKGLCLRLNAGHPAIANLNGGGWAPGNQLLVSSITISEGDIFDIAVSFDGATVKMFIDGAIVGQGSLPVPLYIENNAALGVSYIDSPKVPLFSNIELFYFAFYNKALTEEEAISFGTNSDGLVALFDFSRCLDCVVADFSANKNNLEVFGALPGSL